MDIQYFEQLWREGKVNKGSNESYWDSRAEEFNKSVHSDSSKERVDGILDFLSINHMLNTEDSVLDVGCGPGRFSVEFSKRAANVIAADISEQMLDLAVKNAEYEKINNLSFQKTNWEEFSLEEYGWNKKFDLVTAINCPGIKDRSTLEKMINASKKYCFLTYFVERSDSVRDFIDKNIINRGENKFYNNTVYSIINILWLLGYYPGITYFDSNWERTMPVDAACDYYCSSIENDGGLTDEQKENIRKYLRESSENDIVRERIYSKTAWVYWRV